MTPRFASVAASSRRLSNMYTSTDLLQLLPRNFTSSRLELSMQDGTSRDYLVFFKHDCHDPQLHLR
jgi:hypothetical protein